MKVLIVDDNKAVRLLLRDYLPASADEVYECDNGAEAVTLYKQLRPDWVLMDQDMPLTDGLTAIRMIISRYPEAKICMVTAFNDPALRSEALEAGASGFVVKDDLSELTSLLH